MKISAKTAYVLWTFGLTFLISGSTAIGSAITSAAPNAPSYWSLILALASALGAAGIAAQKSLELPPS